MSARGETSLASRKGWLVIAGALTIAVVAVLLALVFLTSRSHARSPMPSPAEIEHSARSTGWLPSETSLTTERALRTPAAGMPTTDLTVHITSTTDDVADAIVIAWKDMHVAAALATASNTASPSVLILANDSSGVLLEKYDDYVKPQVTRRLFPLGEQPVSANDLSDAARGAGARIVGVETGPLGATVVTLQPADADHAETFLGDAGRRIALIQAALPGAGRPYLFRIKNAAGRTLAVVGYTTVIGRSKNADGTGFEQDGSGVSWAAPGVTTDMVRSPVLVTR